MKLRSLLAAGIAVAASTLIAYAAGYFPGWPIVGNPSYCVSQSTAGVPGTTPQCTTTAPAGPSGLTGNELVPADTELANGQAPQTVLIPSGLLTAAGGASDDVNALIGTDFGQALWQRGTTPLNAATPSTATLGPDGWYVIEGLGAPLSTVTISKQTGATDVPSDSLASARVQRVASQTGTAQICTGQLVRDADSQVFPGKTAIFSVEMLAGANFSPTSGSVNMIIAYHTAADVLVGAANGQGINTATFASSIGATQNISNYTEAINTPVVISTTWGRYSVAAAIPVVVPNTSTTVLGIGVKLCFTPSGTAGANDWFEFDKAQLEARSGSSVGASRYIHNTLVNEYALETARYFQISELPNIGGSITPIYGQGMAGLGRQWTLFNFPTMMAITPVTSPITLGSFEINIAGVPTSPTTVTAGSNTQIGGQLQSGNTVTAGQAIQWINGALGSGRLGFSAEP